MLLFLDHENGFELLQALTGAALGHSAATRCRRGHASLAWIGILAAIFCDAVVAADDGATESRAHHVIALQPHVI